jgi:tRNA pseudouridine55 synthase
LRTNKQSTPPGIIIVYKPPGMSSKDICRKIIPLYGKLKMGHIGTLDPIAEGILPLVFGNYSRLHDVLLHNTKVYECHVQVGIKTDTLDISGDICERKNYTHISKEKLQTIANTMVGKRKQIPPLFSAIKYKGKALYKYAREGLHDQVPLESLAKEVEIFSFQIIDFIDDRLIFEAKVSKGTYIRSLLNDLLVKAGTLGSMSKLIRKRVGAVDLSMTVSLDELLEDNKKIEDFFISLTTLGLGDKLITVPLPISQRLLQGQRIRILPENSQELLKINKTISNGDYIFCNNMKKAFALGKITLDNRGYHLNLTRSLL